jgi:hypothetical protein
MVDAEIIEQKLAEGSPRTLKLFEVFMGDNVARAAENQTRNNRRRVENQETEHRKFIREHGFLKKKIMAGASVRVSQETY